MNENHPIYKAAMEWAEELGVATAKTDGWLRPVFDDGDEDSDWGQAACRFEQSWEGLSHFQCLYSSRMVNKAYDMDAEIPGSKIDRWVGFYEDLLRAFWDAWEEETKLCEVFEKFMEKRGRAVLARSFNLAPVKSLNAPAVSEQSDFMSNNENKKPQSPNEIKQPEGSPTDKGEAQRAKDPEEMAKRHQPSAMQQKREEDDKKK